MIEQTELVINEWTYIPPGTTDSLEEINSELSLEVMRKSASTKKGLACKFTCRYFAGTKIILIYVAQDSYVIDLEDKIDAAEVHRMIRNAYSKFKEKFDLRKLGTVLQHASMHPFDETKMDIHEILHFLN
jgi:hypothetical protein